MENLRAEVESVRFRQPDSVLGEALRMSLLVILYPLAVILILISIASFVGSIPIIYVQLGVVLVLGIGGFFLFKRSLPAGGLKINKMEEWVGMGTLVAVVYVFGQTLLALSSFYSTTVTQSRCIDPSTVNVTSLECRTIQTSAIPQYNILANYGELVLIITVIWTVVFAGLSGLYYILYAKPGN